ncbi:3-beta-hydroxysteroid dehydrogenase [Exophiala viscosa]|uniref:3-beta-hydroxysteroid dehydrogenase n=1 Tax=Exophiala viscosa TaxID=2486360 RepID=A0AAN6DYL5_9EURO|nr:3-beta-hydroxysteroid dehydrogenase [Exophiala viscosa]KAI1622641.1 3-beta-hydroxysteroid dehydrogenase [Exophiala viscosa]
MTDTPRVAVISGGGSGMGLEATTQLTKRGGWNVHILDVSEERGKEVVQRLGSTVTFHKTDVTSYASLSSAFEKIFDIEGRLDFVYANAGIKETGDLYAVAKDTKAPPEVNQLTVDLNLKSVINQSYLASHYFQLSPSKGQGTNLVMTGSAGSVYPLDSAPMYAASKFGVLGFCWSIAKMYKQRFGIRVNTVLPAPVPTNLVTKEEWAGFDSSLFTPPSAIVDVVLKLVDGKDMKDSNGTAFAGKDCVGKAVEVIQGDYYFRTPMAWCNDKMFQAMAANDL